MRVLQVTHRYEPNRGGVERHVKKLTNALKELGHDVTVATYDGGPDGEGLVRRGSIAPGGVGHFNPMAAVDPYGYDVVHGHNIHSLPAILAALSPLGKKTVVTPHYHGDGSTAATSTAFGVYKRVCSLAVSAADEVIAVSSHEKSLIERDMGVDPDIIPHGLEYRRVDGENDGYALVVNRLERYKRVPEAVKAAGEAGVGSVVVGSGPEESAVRDARKEGHALKITSDVSRKRLDSLMKGAEVLVNLSSQEAFGMVVGEALSHGTPAVVAGDSGLSHWGSTKGVKVTDSPEDPKSVARDIISAAWTEVDDEPLPTWEEVARRTDEVYKR